MYVLYVIMQYNYYYTKMNNGVNDTQLYPDLLHLFDKAKPKAIRPGQQQ